MRRSILLLAGICATPAAAVPPRPMERIAATPDNGRQFVRGVIFAGETRSFTVTAAAGAILDVTLEAGNPALGFTVRAPAGANLLSGTAAAPGVLRSLSLPRAGSYRIVIRLARGFGPADAALPFALRLTVRGRHATLVPVGPAPH
jgi:hypothetical protein